MITDHKRVPDLGIQHLVVGVDCEALPGADQRSLGSVDRVVGDGAADGVELHAERRGFVRIDPDPDGRLLRPADVDLAHAVDA